jgi:hypothetical protein
MSSLVPLFLHAFFLQKGSRSRDADVKPHMTSPWQGYECDNCHMDNSEPLQIGFPLRSTFGERSATVIEQAKQQMG